MNPPTKHKAFVPSIPELEALADKLGSDANTARFRALVMISAWCGLRYGEVLELRRKDVDAVVIIGTVIKGDTGHDEVVANAAARAAVDLALQFDKPVALGMTGPGMTREQAFDRIDNARNAVEAAVRMVRMLKEIGE